VNDLPEEEFTDFTKNFPLFPAQHFDFAFSNAPWPIGMHSTAPASLKKKVAAASISRFLRVKSIDRVLKEYFSEIAYKETDPDRIDFRILRIINQSFSTHREAIIYITGIGVKSMGQTIGEWTLMRAPFSIDSVLYCANCGALYECMSLARMMLEQLAWAHRAILESDDEKVSKIIAQDGIGPLKPLLPGVGRLYGWLSDHAHWNYEAHVKSIVYKKKLLGHLFASAYFRATSLLISLIITDIFLKYSRHLLETCDTTDCEKRKYLTVLAENTGAIRRLIDQINADSGGDEQIAYLAAMLH
jgi:hypothetical protein